MKHIPNGATHFFLFMLIVGAMVGTLAYQTKQVSELNTKLLAFQRELHSLTATTQGLTTLTQERFEVIALKNSELSTLLHDETKRLDDLDDSVDDFDREVGKLSGSVEDLEKLTTTDPELLQKYSSVYFLNEHYMPADLTVIDEEYDLVNGKEVTIHTEVWPFLKDMLRAAWRDDVELMVLSGYRSFEEQTTLKESYATRYGVGANQFSADQGYSEHQLGTTVDLTTSAIGENLDTFKDLEAYSWLTKNAHEYGFTLSYPEGNEFYVYEPWHWRFVGVDLASYLERKDKHFYDLDQRAIDDYIITLFDD